MQETLRCVSRGDARKVFSAVVATRSRFTRASIKAINRNRLSLQLAAIALNFGVLVSAVYEGIYARRGGDPTKIRVVSDRAATINNPGYREYHQPTNGKTKERKRERGDGH